MVEVDDAERGLALLLGRDRDGEDAPRLGEEDALPLLEASVGARVLDEHRLASRQGLLEHAVAGSALRARRRRGVAVESGLEAELARARVVEHDEAAARARPLEEHLEDEGEERPELEVRPESLGDERERRAAVLAQEERLERRLGRAQTRRQLEEPRRLGRRGRTSGDPTGRHRRARRPIAPLALGSREGGLGLPQQLAPGRRVLGRGGDAGADRDLSVAQGALERERRDLGPRALGDRERARGVEPGEQHQEPAAALARDERGRLAPVERRLGTRGDGGLDREPDDADDLVARAVAEDVVEQAEPVDVEEDEPEGSRPERRRLVGPGRGEARAELVQHQGCRRQARQVVLPERGERGRRALAASRGDVERADRGLARISLAPVRHDRLADLDPVAGAEQHGVARQRAAVEASPVAAREVADAPAVGRALEDAVLARGRLVVEHDGALERAPDLGRQVGQERDDLAALAVFEEEAPHEREILSGWGERS